MDSPQNIKPDAHRLSGDNHIFSQWVEMEASVSPMQNGNMPSNFCFPSPMPMDATYDMPIPPSSSLLPCSTPSSPCPTMPIDQSPLYKGEQLPGLMPMSIQPSSLVPSTRKTSARGSKPHKTLTDEDRRTICLYHEENKENKKVTQFEIGGEYES
jgi:hypothetical protein